MGDGDTPACGKNISSAIFCHRSRRQTSDKPEGQGVRGRNRGRAENGGALSHHIVAFARGRRVVTISRRLLATALLQRRRIASAMPRFAVNDIRRSNIVSLASRWLAASGGEAEG